MFRKIQSYVTPILLSYVDKYIKDSKTEDTQVSLWNGSVSLHNLELRPDVIQQELNLPFTLSSGHIHELLIQVPWMKIVSEPIVITINTIECILKLNDNQHAQSTSTKPPNNGDEFDTPPGYVQSLVNRIVSNIAFRCNNIILKYVEEDIVVSVNIKQFHLDNVDKEWIPSFAEMTIDDLHTRKLIKLNDITLCLDKRNAAGKIETYLEPLLYKCELEFRLDSKYLGILNKRPIHTRISIHSPRLEFSFSYQQIPMIIRISALFLALKQKKKIFSGCSEITSESTHHISPKLSKDTIHKNSSITDEINIDESWSGWMWSFVQPFPLGYGDEQDASLNTNPIILINVHFDIVTFSFKIPDVMQDTTGIYNNQRKFRYNNICTLMLKNMVCESSSHGFERFCFRGGVEYIEIYPENICPCGISDIESQQSVERKIYYKSTTNKKENLISWPIEYDTQSIVDTMSEEDMLAISPAFAFSYIYCLTIPEESKNNLLLIGPDLENSNFKEETNVSMIFGPFDMYICSGMIHRFSLFTSAIETYDYAPYYLLKLPIKISELPPPTTDDYDALSEFVPKINIKIVALTCKVNVAVWDHFMSIKTSMFSDISSGIIPTMTRKKISISSMSESANSHFEKLKNMPSISIEVEKISSSISNPMYPHRLTYIACQLPDVPAIMLDSCYKYINLSVDNMHCFIVNKSKKSKKKKSNSTFVKISIDDDETKINNVMKIPFIKECSFHISMKQLLLSEYWLKHESMLHDDYNFNMNNITICVSMAKMLAAYHIFLVSVPQQDIFLKNTSSENPNKPLSKSHFILMQTSLLNDAFGDNDMTHLDVNFEGLSFRSIFLLETHTHRMVLNAIKVFAIGTSKDIAESQEKPKIKQVWIISAPENNSQQSVPFMKTVMQFSANTQYLSFFTMKTEEWSLIMDPLICQWLTYSYELLSESAEILTPSNDNSHTPIQKRHSRRSLDEVVSRIGGSSRTLNRLSLAQSSSDREKDYVHGVSNTTQKSSSNNLKEYVACHGEEPKKESGFFYNITRKYFEHKNMAFYVEIEPIAFYFPTKSVSGSDYNSISEAVEDSVFQTENCENMLIFRSPSLLLKSSMLKQNLLSFCVYGLPVKLPSDVWDLSKHSYPWTLCLKNFSCSTLSYKQSPSQDYCIVETDIIKKFSSDLTISFTPKIRKQTENFIENSQKTENSDLNPTSVTNFSNANLYSLPEKISTDETTESLKKGYTRNFHYFKNILSNFSNFKDLSAVGVCIHIDTEIIMISINEKQMVLLNTIAHGISELSKIIFNIHKDKKIQNLSYNLQSSHNLSDFNIKQRNLSISENVMMDISHDNLSKDSDARDSSCIGDSNKVDDKDTPENIKQTESVKSELFNISVWIQWTISRICFKAYATQCENKNKKDSRKLYLRLVLAADDIVSSLDIQHEYLKCNMKVVTAGIHHYKRYDPHDTWKLGDFCGIILKGKDFIKHAKSSGENSFLLINITRARCSSVHNKWGDVCKKRTKLLHTSDSKYISEIEISLQALDLILNLKSLEPFTYIFTTSNTSVVCKINEMENNIPSLITSQSNAAHTVACSWDCRKMALCYFEGYHLRIIMPVVSLNDNVRMENVLIFQTERISMLPIADNQVCRSPLRPDLYQQAARTGLLNVPGSDLEDRQCQLTLKGICLYTTQWNQIENSYALELQSQPVMSENPALQWNDVFSEQYNTIFTLNIVEKVDICVVLALSIFHQSELICGPTIDISIVSDIEIRLSVSQYSLIKTLSDEFVSFMKNWRKTSVGDDELELYDTSSSICPYYKFINGRSLRYSHDICQFELERNTPTLSVDTGIASDMMSNFTNNSKISSKYTLKSFDTAKLDDKTNTSSSADHFDIFITFGKIGFNLFEILAFPEPSLSMDNLKSTGDKDEQITYTRPLLYITFHQPNFSYSYYNFEIKSQFSIFHISMSLGDECSHKNIPKFNDFLIDFFETKTGTPDTISGISPAFLTVKWKSNAAKKYSIVIDMKCPVRITLSLDRILKINKIIKHLLSTTVSVENCPSSTELGRKSFLESMKSILIPYSNIDITTSQIVLAVIVQDQIDFEVLFSLLSYTHNITFDSRQEAILNHGVIDSLSLSLRKTDDRKTKILLNPWTFGFRFDFGWKMWHYSFTSPIIRIYIVTDRLLIDLSSEHIKILFAVFKYWNENWNFLTNEIFTTVDGDDINVDNCSNHIWVWNSTINNHLNEQHYKDDLRAGAFKFINGGTGYPLAYQIYIGSSDIVWCYPQPRAITRVHSFPIPFKIVNNEVKGLSKESIPCTLEYFSEVTHSFNYYAKFYIKQDERVKLDLSQFSNCTVLSSMWRIVMFLDENSISLNRNAQKLIYFDKNTFSSINTKLITPTSTNESSFPISTQALVASLRIDSYFNPHLVPKFQVALNISSIEINLCNNYSQRTIFPLPDSLKLFQLDGCLPSSHVFCTLLFSSTRLTSNIWNKNVMIIKLDCDFRCDIINGSDMLLDNVIDCVDLSANCSLEENNENLLESVIYVDKFKLSGGPQQVHILFASYRLWRDILSSGSSLTASVDEKCILENQMDCNDCLNAESNLLITKYIISNDTNLSLKFGQVNTEENIILESRKSHLYFWRMPDAKHLLRLGINLSNWKFSEGICIEQTGVKNVQLYHDEDSKPITIIVLVENLNPVQLSVTLMGQLIIMNILPNKFDMKLYHKKSLQLHGSLQSPIVSIEGSMRSPSLLFTTDSDFTIRLRFSESENGWSGDIPLKECIKGNTPWLVKVPVKGEMQHVSIWCRVVRENKSGRTLVTLNSLYIIRSHLPMKFSVSLETEKHPQTSDYLIDGKGSSHFLMCPGTTITKQTIKINYMGNTMKENNMIPLHYDLVDQAAFFPPKKDNVDVDKILNNIKQWIENEQLLNSEWPYIFPENDTNWNPIEQHHSTEFTVRYLPSIYCIDSLILDMTPWALFGNCTGIKIFICGPNGEDLCAVNHLDVIIPPLLLIKDNFFCRVVFDSETYLSGPLYISSTTFGPYERKPYGCITLENSSSFTLNCYNSLCVFSMACEIKHNIDVFRLSSNYVFINQLPHDIFILPVALNSSSNIVETPHNYKDLFIKVLPNHNKATGIPINKFHIPMHSQLEKNNIEEEEYFLYIYLTNSIHNEISCPVRIDKFVQRKSVSLKTEMRNIPVILSCQEYRGQIFITVDIDKTPQFLIINNANMTIAISQILKEYITSDTCSYDTKLENLPKNVVEESWKSDWHCIIQPGEELYYTMPTQSSSYPEMFIGTSTGIEDSLYITFAYLETSDCTSYTWSVPVDVSTHNLEKFVKLPGYFEDIKVLVENHCYATTVTINNVTQDDISASDIRQRLLISTPIEKLDIDLSFETPSVDVAIENSHESSSSHKCLTNYIISNEQYQSLDSFTSNKNSLFSLFQDFKLCNFMKSIKTTAIFNSICISMTKNKDADNTQRNPHVISLYCDHVVLTSNPHYKGFKIVLTINDIQLDNPLFINGGYDFNVVVVKQKSSDSNYTPVNWKPLVVSQILNVSKIVEQLRQNCSFSSEVNIEVWNRGSNVFSGFSDLNIMIGSISLYLEDTYISTLLDYITDFVPTFIPSICIHTVTNSQESSEICIISIPEYIIWEGIAIANPIRCKRLQIQPLNILLSLHSSKRIYLALDHSPLQFAKFERINVLTSSYRLGHALTMHYLYEALFKAGWVVGSLEILGSPTGLAKRLGAGLFDLVKEPCSGLMRGPWGFVVGMTHGSASLLKHFTQGTVESMSMVMGNVARNLDRLSLDEEHMRRTECARRHRPEGLVQALTRGLQGLGLSLLGAIGGIAHEALMIGYEQGGGPAAVAAGLTRGFMGALTKPLSATADFLALTGQGLLYQAGWNHHPSPRELFKDGFPISKNENFRLKLGKTFAGSSLLYICQGYNKDTALDITIVITNKWIILLDTHNDKVLEMMEIEFWKVMKVNSATGELLLALKQTNPSQDENKPNTNMEPELHMDPALRARIAAYVGLVEENHTEKHFYRIMLPLRHLNHCASMIEFALFHNLNQGFPIL